MERAIREFIEYKRTRGCKESTLKNNRVMLQWISRIIEENGFNDNPSTWTESDIREILRAMKISPNSEKIAANIMVKLAHINENKVECRVMTNDERPNAKWISVEELNFAIKAATNPTVKIILHLGGNYGLRRSEMANLRLSDFHGSYMTVHGKGHGVDGKIRNVPLLENDPIITDYIEWRKNAIAHTHSRTHTPIESDLLLFYSNSKAHGFMTAHHISTMIKSYFDKMGIDATPHSLRREFITSAYRSGADIVSIMRIVGHKNPQTTEKYIERDFNKERETMILRNFYISTSV